MKYLILIALCSCYQEPDFVLKQGIQVFIEDSKAVYDIDKLEASLDIAMTVSEDIKPESEHKLVKHIDWMEIHLHAGQACEDEDNAGCSHEGGIMEFNTTYSPDCWYAVLPHEWAHEIAWTYMMYGDHNHTQPELFGQGTSIDAIGMHEVLTTVCHLGE